MRVFMTKRTGGCGVQLVPRAQFELLKEDGYREATAAEVASWYRLQNIRPPACVLEQASSRPLGAPVLFVLNGTETGPRAA